ncbi:DNA/RNA-binding domain of Phe-tRNA-synthetase-like protein [Streptomyces sp. SAI-144]|uniref:hypothetical protein n=1 Tax=Streptomyces sp. SAI-144 TaxID=2940544 RepID=UPI0024761BBA|nr:hypothetical protein [Streptomyces sp. SAI-144]MDH6436754.1 DNA/RNA-binding domain of Phe-tRNA-synthetase-like protein [Streptomyces sp. SAI-144]
MTDRTSLEVFLAGARIDPAVTTLRPDYLALLIAVDGIAPVHQGDDAEEHPSLARAEAATSDPLANGSAGEVPHVATWHEACRAFGVEPQRTRNSLEALLRRASTGRPQVNGLTDIYNAISVIHQVPLGGKDLDG